MRRGESIASYYVRRGTRHTRAVLPALGLLIAGCAPAGITLPQGSSTPISAHEEILSAAVDQCRGVRNMELLLALSGHTGGRGLRGRIRAALSRPGSLRLEGVSPFGAPGFILTARASMATLVLPRDRRVVTDAPAADLLEVLAGVSLSPDDFRAVLTGCFVPDPKSVGGRAYGDGWIVIDLEGGATVYLKEIEGVPAVVVGTRGPLTVEYAEHTRGIPRRVRVQARGTGSTDTDLTAVFSQVSMNIELHEDAFVAKVREDYASITLDELRRIGLLEATHAGTQEP